jgi:hypothetical protein
MRPLLLGSAIVVLTLADFAPGYAHKIHHHYRGVQPYYAACVCHWRYATDNSTDACRVAVSCDVEGGRCVRACSPREIVRAPAGTGAAQQTTSTPSPSPAELARTCDALTAKAFPPKEPGNPAAGSTKGSGLEAQSYFRKCVANGGRVDNSTDGH